MLGDLGRWFGMLTGSVRSVIGGLGIRFVWECKQNIRMGLPYISWISKDFQYSVY